MASPAAGDDEDVLEPVRRQKNFGAPCSPISSLVPMAPAPEEREVPPANVARDW